MVSKDRSYRVYGMMCITTKLHESIMSSPESIEIYYNMDRTVCTEWQVRRGLVTGG